MSKIVAVCPYCKRANTVEKTTFGPASGLETVRCAHCAKSWERDLSHSDTLAKSEPAPSPVRLAELRVQVDELVKRINGIIQQREAASRVFNTKGVEKADVAGEELQKALDNGKPVGFQAEERNSPRFQTADSVGPGQRVRAGQPFDTHGMEKSDTADSELHKALSNGKPVGFSPRG